MSSPSIQYHACSWVGTRASRQAMSGICMLELQQFLIKEQVAFLKTASTYDIFDPETREQVGVAREQPGSFVTMLRWFISKRHLPTRIEVREMADESLVFTIRRPLGVWR